MAQQKYWDGTQWVPVASKITIPTFENPPANPNDGDMYFQVNEGGSLPIIGSGNLVEKKVITADCSSVTFSGLDSLVDGDYYLEASVTPTAVANNYIKLGVNGDTTDANYISQSLYAYSTTVGGAIEQGPALVWKDSGYAIVFSVNIKVVAGIVHMDVCGLRQINSSQVTSLKSSVVKKATISSITSITLFSSVSNIGAGSKFTLYKSNSAQQLVPYNPVDITSRISDYLLKPGEVVYRDYTDATSVPLYIKTEEGSYEMEIINSLNNNTYTNSNTWLNPNNNTVTAGQINHIYTDIVGYTNNKANISFSGAYDGTTMTAFDIGYGQVNRVFCKINTKTDSKQMSSEIYTKRSSTSFESTSRIFLWEDITTPWISLGTVVFPFAHSGRIIIKRII